MSLMRLARTSKSSVSPSPRVVGLSRFRPSTRCQARSRLFLDGRPPLAFAKAGSSFLVLRPLQSSFAHPPAPSFRSELYQLRVLSPPRDLSERVHYLRGFHPSLRSAPRLSQPHDGLLRFRFRRLVASHCHVQGSLCSIGSPIPRAPNEGEHLHRPCHIPPARVRAVFGLSVRVLDVHLRSVCVKSL